MKQPRTLKIIRLISSVTRSTLRGEKLVLAQTSEGLERLGGIYIKFLQIVVLNLDPFSQTGFKKLLDVYEKSAPDPINIYRYLSRELPPDKLAQFKKIEPLPFATGSFGQVYKAELITGQAVIIKILRPSVQRYLRYDLRLIGTLCWAYSIIDRQKMLNFRGIFADFKRISLQETDYVREAAVATEYYESYKNHPHMVTPKTYNELCTKHVLVQDLIQGVSITNILDLKLSGVDAEDYCRKYLNTDLIRMLQTVGVEMLTRAIAGEVFQADPHPGNIVLLANNKVALIDFGMSTHVIKNRLSLYELSVEYLKFYSNQLNIEDFTMVSLKFLAPDIHAAISHADTLLDPTGQEQAMVTRLREAIKRIYEDADNRIYVDKLMSGRQIMKVLFFVINKDNRFGFTFDLSASALIKAIQGYFVMMARFEPTGWAVRDAFQEAVSISSQQLDNILASPATEMSPEKALETLSYWFDKMARNDPWLMNRVVGGYLK